MSNSSLDMNDTENKTFWETPELKALTESTKKLSDCSASDYDLIFFVGGFGTMWDFPFDSQLAKIAQDVYEKGGIVGAVCHGPIGLMNIKLSSGEYLVAGKEVAAFCNEEEAAIGLQDKLPKHDGLGATCEEVLTSRGAKYTKASAWAPHIACAERLFTGQNPMSAGPVADAIVAAMQ